MIWNPTMEKMPREQLRALQDERLKDVVRRVYENVPFYRDKMQKLGVTPKDIHGVRDIELLPFTEKHDLRDNYPFGLFAVPQSEIVRIHASSGTTGKPTVAGYTSGDIDRWAELMARTKDILLRRPADPREIAEPIVFLCSQSASYITATSLEVSGGSSVVLNPAYSYEQREKGR
ncbi:MAG: SDR family oxidoreductase [Clostridia bacterium]|nr:SDR family oxidoreductase [Clostridia bacterium]